jgi:hypothetical protein
MCRPVDDVNDRRKFIAGIDLRVAFKMRAQVRAALDLIERMEKRPRPQYVKGTG